MGSKISIITATYNSSATVRDTLESVKCQTYKSVEHIIVDGLSTDLTLDIVRHFPHVHKIISEKDKGIYDAMNKGIAMCSGDIIGILNSDDIYANSHVLEKVAAAFESESIDALYADLFYVDHADTDKVIRYWKSGKFQPKSFYYGWMPPHPTFFVRKKLYDQFGGFNLSLRSSADYELMLRFLLKNNVPATYLPETIVKMRVGGMSNHNLANRFKANREDRIAWQLNGLEPYFFTIPLKPLRKLGQYIFK
ncbi:glycosyltransferase family 2 protein [Flavihumibacter solisilvae]|uniref:Family 2 glycosyl transferase n=1 Tax=Flavihumibacter solisilvae TaxID=1349421 RepID=A0A0C1L522_9BACT|nr:glycosyltransferase family 2 protein [Flavihumibacter solisilvae]KIC94656.1 family 2 glycosyl transferase [Flavihumibacter solisilvae]